MCNAYMMCVVCSKYVKLLGGYEVYDKYLNCVIRKSLCDNCRENMSIDKYDMMPHCEIDSNGINRCKYKVILTALINGDIHLLRYILDNELICIPCCIMKEISLNNPNNYGKNVATNLNIKAGHVLVQLHNIKDQDRYNMYVIDITSCLPELINVECKCDYRFRMSDGMRKLIKEICVVNGIYNDGTDYEADLDNLFDRLTEYHRIL